MKNVKDLKKRKGGGGSWQDWRREKEGKGGQEKTPLYLLT